MVEFLDDLQVQRRPDDHLTSHVTVASPSESVKPPVVIIETSDDDGSESHGHHHVFQQQPMPNSLIPGDDSGLIESSNDWFDGLLSGWTTQELSLALAGFILMIAVIFYIILTLYRCCCSRNYAEWRSAWSVWIKSTLSRKRIKERKRRSLSDTLFDAAPIRLSGDDEEEIEQITSTLDSPFVASHSMTGDVIIWDVLSGECHTRIRRNSSYPSEENHENHHQTTSTSRVMFSDHHKNGDNHETPAFVPKHKPSDSCSSADSTGFGSSPASNNSGSGESIHQKTDNSCHQIKSTPTRESVTPHVVQSPSSHHNSHHHHNYHRRHHSMGSIHTHQLMSSKTNDYNFVPFYSQKNWSSREVLTDLFRSACSSGSSSSAAHHNHNSSNVHHAIHNNSGSNQIPANTSVDSPLSFKAIWCLEMFGRNVFIGCENGRIEVWNLLTGIS